MTPLEVAKFLYTLRTTLGEIGSLGVPTVAVMDGVALGGGLELVSHLDCRKEDYELILVRWVGVSLRFESSRYVGMTCRRLLRNKQVRD